MKLAIYELRLMFHSRLASIALLLLFVLALLAVWSGMQAVHGQQGALARIAVAHQADFAPGQHDAADAGTAAYATPHLTTNPPSPLAFAAFGQRDLQPYALRVTLLGLHAQLYESEPINPELAMPGRFDFAFVLVYLAPLFIIALMHDLVAAERESGRLRLLASLPQASAALWRRRIGLRLALVLLAALLPLGIGMGLSGVGARDAALAGLTAILYLAFWFGLAAWVAARVRTAAAGAALLLACLVSLTMILPTMANAAIARMVPVSKGIELALAQRQEVHQGWDLPKQVTFDKFFRTHPEWKDTPPVTGRFHWKWYFAMHQAGDDAVAARALQYRSSMLEREALTAHAAYFLPSAAAQLVFHRAAHSDLHSQLAYQQRIAAFHTALRHYYYPYLFNEQPFGAAGFAQLPVYRARAPAGDVPLGLLGALALLAAIALYGGLRQTSRVEN